MIKKLLSIALVATAFVSNAQNLKVQRNVSAEQVSVRPNGFRLGGGNQVLNTVDTLMPGSAMLPSGCAVATPTTSLSGFVFYRVDAVNPKDSGYFFGTNIFPFAGTTLTDIAQKYPSGTAGLTVTNVLTWAAKAHGTTATTSANIYDEDITTAAPNAVLGTSTPIAMAAYSTSQYNNYVFATPVTVAPNVNFFASITIPTFGGTDADTMAIVSTKFGCSTSADSLSWMNISPYGWFPVNGLFGANLDLMIWPVVSIPTSGTIAYTKGSVSLYAASPNPANNTVNINFSLANASKVEIEVIDITGKTVKTIKNNETFSSNGKHSVAIDVTNLESGSYFYSINANGTKMFSKFVVTK